MKKKLSGKAFICLALILCLCIIGLYTTSNHPSESKISYIHISFDDVTYCLENLSKNEYNSVFDEPFFGWLKYLHDTYNAKFSLYTYLDTIESVPNSYVSELSQTSDWIKFGLHATSDNQNFGNSTYTDGNLAWETFANHVIRITGNPNSIDRLPRLHYFAGNSECLTGMKDAHHGALGFLSADDDRISYNFTKEVSDYLYEHDYFLDTNIKLVFLSTDMRTDWFSENFTTENNYQKPTQTSVYSELETRYHSDAYTSCLRSYIVFGHEWKIYDGTQLSENRKTWFEDILLFSKNYNIKTDYPQNQLNLYS